MTDGAVADDPLARYRDLIDEYATFRTVCSRGLPPVVRVNPVVADPETVVMAFQEDGVAVDSVPWHDGLFVLDTDSPGNTWPYVHGWVHGQEAVSTLPGLVMDSDPNAVVLDLCAAPGSKTSQIAGLQDDAGTVVANDVDLGRLSALRSNCDRLGLTSVVVTNRDGRHFRPDSIGLDGFDSVLVDAPCSCEGTVRKNPDTFTDWSLEYVEYVSSVQTALLDRAITVTNPGGTVVYSTCTFAPEENEAVLDRILTQRDDCRLVDVDLPITHESGVTEWQDTTYDSNVTKSVRVYPHHNDTGGFFLAKLEVAE